MTLQKYQKKRVFNETPEPKGKLKSSKGLPIFCIQKHDATRLHYDFRLEHKGVLLSWAVPKEPSLDPKDKRLAIQVEDHPFDYRKFEGVIPKGNYGAGTVMLWDEGIYTVPGMETKEEIEKAIDAGLKKGHLQFILKGEKLRGVYSLVHLKSQDNDQHWLLIKGKDDEKQESEMDWNVSVKTGKTLDEIAGNKITKSKKVSKKKIPNFIKPMLSTLIEAPFDHPSWLFETKWDGYRTLAYLDNKVLLYSRNENIFNAIFPSIVQELSKLKAQAILDGEVVILDEKGKSDFQLMQNYQKTNVGALFYYVFDLLFLNGEDLRDLPLLERKEKLQELLKTTSLSFVRFSEHIFEKGIALFKKAEEHRLEGIIAKHKDSHYLSTRSREWLKIKTHERQEAIIGGFTTPRGGRKKFGALLLGVYNDKKELVYIGHVGTGFKERLLEDIYKQMEPLEQVSCPFSKKIRTNMPARWIKPKLVCEVRFSEWTQEGIMRQPTFQGMRLDKKPKEVKKEKALEMIPKKEINGKKAARNLSNPSKIYWPKEKYTKENLLEYYQEIAPFILPYLKNRPMVLRRFPEGIEGQNFIQKDTTSLHLPEGTETIVIQHEEKKLRYLIVQDKSTLEYAVNLGTIEFHPFHAKVDHLEYPDYFILDLDPEQVAFDTVLKTAKTIYEYFTHLKIPCYCKTSGGRGLHIYIPLAAKYTTDQVAQFGEIIALLLHKELGAITSLERSPAKRQKKIYLDVLQNRSKQTIIAPYSLRGKPFAPVSTPLHWEELAKGLQPVDFNIKTIFPRLKKIGDIFKPVLGKGFDLKKWVQQYQG